MNSEKQNLQVCLPLFSDSFLGTMVSLPVVNGHVFA